MVRFGSLLVLFILNSINLLSVDMEFERLKKESGYLFKQNQSGTDFWFSVPPGLENNNESNKTAIRILISAEFTTQVKIEVFGSNRIKTFFIPANTIHEEILRMDEAQPFRITSETPPDQVYKQKAVNISTNMPVTVWCISYQGWSTGAFQVFPTSVLGKEYFISAYPVDGISLPNDKNLPSTVCITAPYDNTKVRMTIGGSMKTVTTGNHKPGDLIEVNLDRGDVWMIATDSDSSDLSGSYVYSNRPISIVTGNACANVPVGKNTCDYIVEMEVPTKCWGKIYPVHKTNYLAENSLVRIYSKEKMTEVYRKTHDKDKIYHDTLTIVDTFIETDILGLESKSTNGSVFLCDVPINVSSFDQGYRTFGMDSDPTMTNIIPYEQFVTSTGLLMPNKMTGVKDDHFSVTVIYTLNSQGEIDSSYKLLKYDGQTYKEFLLMDEESINFRNDFYSSENLNLGIITFEYNEQSPFKIISNYPFAAYFTGAQEYQGFGTALCRNFKDLISGDTETPKPVFTYDSAYTGHRARGTVTDFPDDPKFRTNLSQILLLQNLSYNCSLYFGGFVNCETRTTNWELNPIDVHKPWRAYLTFKDCAGNDTTLLFYFDPTDVIENKNIAFSISPNPASDYIEITGFSKGASTLVQGEEIRIYNVLGESVMSASQAYPSTGSVSDKIDVSGLSAGLYFVRVGEWTGKFVKVGD